MIEPPLHEQIRRLQTTGRRQGLAVVLFCVLWGVDEVGDRTRRGNVDLRTVRALETVDANGATTSVLSTNVGGRLVLSTPGGSGALALGASGSMALMGGDTHILIDPHPEAGVQIVGPDHHRAGFSASPEATRLDVSSYDAAFWVRPGPMGPALSFVTFDDPPIRDRLGPLLPSAPTTPQAHPDRVQCALPDPCP